MNLLNSAAPYPRRTLPTWLPPIAGFLAAAFVASVVCRPPLPYSLSPAVLIGSALERVLGVLFANAATVWGLEAISRRTNAADAGPLILQTSLTALWLAPFVLFIRGNSPWAVAIMGVLVAGIVKSIRIVQAQPQAEEQASPVLSPGNHPFRLLESWPYFRWQLCGAGAALCVQTGAIAAFAGDQFSSALLVGASSAVWTWSFTRDDSRKPSTASTRTFLLVSFALILTVGSLVQYLRPTYGVRGFGLPSFASYAATHGDQPGQDSNRKSPGAIHPATDGDPGVVLLPDTLTRTRLVAPPPLIENAPLTGHGIAKPLEIPFEGVYWFFKAPDVHPPRTSRQAHGSPERLDIRSTDRRPLSMEAHQNLGSMIDLACCSRIQVAIRNADRYPETVSLELVLINSIATGKPSQSLGRIMVRSTRPWKLYDEPAPSASETLNFLIPGRSPLRRFDEVSIVFRIASVRADAGPKIAIDHFVLVPRGL